MALAGSIMAKKAVPVTTGTLRTHTLTFGLFLTGTVRDWPRRKPHEPPKLPVLHTRNEGQKALLNQHMGAA